MVRLKEGLLASIFLLSCKETRPPLLGNLGNKVLVEEVGRIDKEFESCNYLKVRFHQYGYSIDCGENSFVHYSSTYHQLFWENINYNDHNNDGKVDTMCFGYPKLNQIYDGSVFCIELNGENSDANMIYQDILKEIMVQDVDRVWEERWNSDWHADLRR